MSEATNKLFCDAQGNYYIASNAQYSNDQHLPFTVPLNAVVSSTSLAVESDKIAEQLIADHPISDVHPIDPRQEEQKLVIDEHVRTAAQFVEEQAYKKSSTNTGIQSSSSLTANSVKVSNSKR